MFYFFNLDNDDRHHSEDEIGIYQVNSLADWGKAEAQLKRLNQLSNQEEDTYRKKEIDIAITEQFRQIHAYARKYAEYDSKFFSANLEKLLNENSMRTPDLEAILHVSAGYVARTLAPDSKKRLSVDIVWRIAELFSVNIDDLLSRDLTEPSKDLRQVLSFVNRLSTGTINEDVRWENVGTVPSLDNKDFFFTDAEGVTRFSPNNEDLSLFEPKGIYSATTIIGTVFFVEMFSIIEGTEYRIYKWNEAPYALLPDGTQVTPLLLVLSSAKDRSGMLLSECEKLNKAIKTRENDFTISNQARALIDEYLKLTEIEIPF